MTPFLLQATDRQPLAAGNNHSGWLVTHADGSRYAVKTTPGVPRDMFPLEAEGLDALRGAGAVGAPRVVAVGPEFLALEALAPAPDHVDSAFWARLGRSLAALHEKPQSRFGWHRDNWLGQLRQDNRWADDGYEFFAQRRILRYLAEPGVRAALDATERSTIERLCARLPELVPPSHPALTHGDLWPGNVMAGPDGTPYLIDPAVSWTWPAVDLSMMLCCGAPASFFDAYHEIRPPEPDWRAHLELLHLRNLLSVLAHGWFPVERAWVARLVRRFG